MATKTITVLLISNQKAKQRKTTKTTGLLISSQCQHCLTNKAVRVANTAESFYTIKKKKSNEEFSVVTPQQSNFIKPVDTPTIVIIPEGTPDLTTYLNEQLRPSKQEQQSNTFCLPSLENPCETKDHTTIQTRVFNEVNELKQNNPKISAEIHRNLERLDWTGTMLTEPERQPVEDILVEYHEIFGTHNWSWNEHGKLSETNTKKRQNCLQPKPTNGNLLERWLYFRVGSVAQVRK